VTEPYHWKSPAGYLRYLDSGIWCKGAKEQAWQAYLAEWQARQQERLIKALEGAKSQ
jgi:hypothetical protein